MFKLLFIGDIVGRPGRVAVRKLLPELKKEYDIDFVLANGENLAAGKGLTYEKYQEMLDAGVDYFTTGNHVFAKREFLPYLDDESIKVIRPANYAGINHGRGFAKIETKNGSLLLINLIGQAFMHGEIDNYFDVLDKILAENTADMIFVDFHAEATSEKAIMGYSYDGKLTAMVGTHTHVPTADERILPQGTAFQTDVGMTGPLHSTLGAEIKPYYDLIRYGTKAMYEVAKGPAVFNSTLFTIDENHKVVNVERIQRMID